MRLFSGSQNIADRALAALYREGRYEFFAPFSFKAAGKVNLIREVVLERGQPT